MVATLLIPELGPVIMQVFLPIKANLILLQAFEKVYWRMS
jgi:hypothetical protein